MTSSELAVEVPPSCERAIREAIGRLRCDVWAAEESLDRAQFPQGMWWDELDEASTTRHWIIFGTQESDGDTKCPVLAAAARLTLHSSLDEGYRDVQLWRRSGAELPLPTCDLGRLVVDSNYRGRGYAKALNAIRVAAAREMGAKSIMVTASVANARLLEKELGFFPIGQTIVFSDRPNTTFHALQLNLS